MMQLFMGCSVCMQLLEDVRALKPRCSGDGGCSIAALGCALREQGYLVSVREAQPRECGKACGRACLEKLQHTYIVVSGSLSSAVTVRSQMQTPAVSHGSSAGRKGHHVCF
jgi:hypothetical protein